MFWVLKVVELCIAFQAVGRFRRQNLGNQCPRLGDPKEQHPQGGARLDGQGDGTGLVGVAGPRLGGGRLEALARVGVSLAPGGRYARLPAWSICSSEYRFLFMALLRSNFGVPEKLQTIWTTFPSQDYTGDRAPSARSGDGRGETSGAQPVFQAADLPAHRRLADIQLTCHSGEGAEAGRHLEGQNSESWRQAANKVNHNLSE